MSDDPHTHKIHTVLQGHDQPLCGAPDPGPIDFSQPFKVEVCGECMAAGNDAGVMSEELTMRFYLGTVRERLRQKLRGLSELDRATYKEQIRSIATAGLLDPAAAPALYDEGQILAALYAIAGVRAGHYHMRRAGVRPTWAILDKGLDEIEMITVALVEGTPL